MYYIEYEKTLRELKATREALDKRLKAKEWVLTTYGGYSCGNSKNIDDIDKDIDGLKTIIEEREKILNEVLQLLKTSQKIEDKVYLFRFVYRMKVCKVAAAVSYSEPQVYRILRRISDSIVTKE